MHSKQIRRRLVVSLSIASMLCVCIGVHALFITREIENVPIDRVIQNLERRASESPKDVQIRINLARIHAMAYASKSETAPVAKPRNPGDPQSNDPEFGVLTSQFRNVQVRPAPDTAAMELARQHMTNAIANYDIAISIDPANLVARIGRAWCPRNAVPPRYDPARASSSYHADCDSVRRQSADFRSHG
jgi:hypothetical protein